MPTLRDRGEQDTYKTAIRSVPSQWVSTKYVELTLEANAVALQTVHGLSEEVLSSGGHPGDIILFPLNGSVDVFKDLLDGVGNFSPDTIAWNQGDLSHIESSACLYG